MANFNVPNNLTSLVQEDYRQTHFINPQVLAEKILKQTATSCSITIPERNNSGGDKNDLDSTYRVITIPFYMSTDFGFDLHNDFRELVAIGDNQFIDFYNSMNAFTGGAQVTPQSDAMSTKVWRGSTFGGFKVDCLFICTNRRHNPVDIIKKLATCCLPRKLGKNDGLLGQVKDLISSVIGTTKLGANTVLDAAQSNGILSQETVGRWKNKVNTSANTINNLQQDMGMVAPLDYGIKFSGEENATQAAAPIKGTTVTLQIGDWFRASQLVVKDISGIRFSKEIIRPADLNTISSGTNLFNAATSGMNSMGGFPLYAQCSLSLEPASMMYDTKFEGYFQNPVEAIANKIKYYGTNYDELP